MKNCLFALLLVTAFNIKMPAQIKVSLFNGNWSDPNIWLPTGVPSSTDSVLISSQVVLDMDVTLINSYLSINPFMSLKEDGTKRRLNLINITFSNIGKLSVSYMDVLNPLLFTNNDSIFVNEVFTSINSILLMNYSYLYVRDSLLHYSGTFINYGIVTTDNFIFNGGSMSNGGIINALKTTNDGIFNNSKSITTADIEINGLVTNQSTFNITKDMLIANTGKLDNALTGIVTTDNFLHNHGTVTNGGSLTIKSFLKNEGYFSNSNSLTVHGDVQLLDSVFINSGNARGYSSLYNDATAVLENYGIVTTDNFIHSSGTITTFQSSLFVSKHLYISGNASGATSAFCISDSTNIAGSISGYIDICDGTPPSSSPPVDVLTGTIENTVTYCQGGHCNAIGVKENPSEKVLMVYPNPVSSVVNVIADFKGDYLLQLHNLLGQLVHEERVSVDDVNHKLTVPMGDKKNGTYFLSIRNENSVYKAIIYKIE